MHVRFQFGEIETLVFLTRGGHVVYDTAVYGNICTYDNTTFLTFSRELDVSGVCFGAIYSSRAEGSGVGLILDDRTAADGTPDADNKQWTKQQYQPVDKPLSSWMVDGTSVDVYGIILHPPCCCARCAVLNAAEKYRCKLSTPCVTRARLDAWCLLTHAELPIIYTGAWYCVYPKLALGRSTRQDPPVPGSTVFFWQMESNSSCAEVPRSRAGCSVQAPGSMLHAPFMFARAWCRQASGSILYASFKSAPTGVSACGLRTINTP